MKRMDHETIANAVIDPGQHSELLWNTSTRLSYEALELKHRLAKCAIYSSACAVDLREPEYGSTTTAQFPAVIIW